MDTARPLASDITLESEIKDSYMTYAMSVIFARALPDARDGLKPVQRRILYTMHEMGLAPNRQHVKCAKVTGEVMGKYHPHGDQVIYPALVRLAQDFNQRYLMVDGQGNFGSVDGDPPAAQRYTECRLARAATPMMEDIDEDTVDFQPNYDDREEEPTVLPGRFPNLLCNGGTGIAVGMATNIPPHNVNEVCDGIIELIGRPEMTVQDLMQIVPGPDFPTAGFILGHKGIQSAYETGRGSVVMQARTAVEPIGQGREAIIVTELPYQVNKASLVQEIAACVREKRIEGISDLRDETDRKGMRLVIELRRDADANVTLNQLYKRTQLRSTYAVNMLALVDGVPRTINLKRAMEIYVDHRREVITRRSRFRLARAEERAHILEGYLRAIDMLDEVIALIRSSQTPAIARQRLQDELEFSEAQAQAILDLTLSRLTGMEREKIQNEYNETLALIADLKDILANPARVDAIIVHDLDEIKKTHGDERRTRILAGEADDINIEDLIAEEDMIVTITRTGYIKRLPVDTYRVIKRGGKGVIGLTKKEEDEVQDLFVASTHHYLLFFTDQGRVYRIKAFEVPPASRTARGAHIANLLELEKGERVTATIAVPSYDMGGYLVMVTERGIIKKTALKAYDTCLKVRGIIAMTVAEGDSMRWVKWTDGNRHLIFVTRHGMSICFPEAQARPMGRQAGGVKGITLGKGDSVVGFDVVDPDRDLLIVTEGGYGKRTLLSEYRPQSRGGKGLKTANITSKNGPIVACEVVVDTDELMLLTSVGMVIRMPVEKIRRTGRSAQGVILVRMEDGAKVRSAAKIIQEQEE